MDWVKNHNDVNKPEVRAQFRKLNQKLFKDIQELKAKL